MPQSKRSLHATAAQTTNPPTTLPPTHRIARVLRPAGNNLYRVEFAPEVSAGKPGEGSANVANRGDEAPAGGTEVLVELASRFRNAIWLKIGSFVVVDVAAMGGRENKLGGEIVNVVREVKGWRKMEWWPREFAKREVLLELSSDEEESVVGKMPPSESEGEDEEGELGEVLNGR